MNGRTKNCSIHGMADAVVETGHITSNAIGGQNCSTQAMSDVYATIYIQVVQREDRKL